MERGLDGAMQMVVIVVDVEVVSFGKTVNMVERGIAGCTYDCAFAFLDFS